MPLIGPDVAADKAAFIDETARLYGQITLAEGVTVWPYVVMRAEMSEIRIGSRSNIQDHTMVHIGYDIPTIIGENVTVAHRCVIHGCTIEDNVLVGVGATIMDGAVIGENSIIAPGSVVKEGTVIPPNSIVAGMPAVVKKERNNYVANVLNAHYYHRNGLAYAKGDYRAWTGEGFDAWKRETLARIESDFEALFGPA